jgi:hypothetical protein
MSDEKDPLKNWRELIASGNPLQTVTVELPMKFYRMEDGGIVIDTPALALMGINQAAILRIVLPEAALGTLHRWLIEQFPDGPADAAKPRSVQ